MSCHYRPIVLMQYHIVGFFEVLKIPRISWILINSWKFKSSKLTAFYLISISSGLAFGKTIHEKNENHTFVEFKYLKKPTIWYVKVVPFILHYKHIVQAVPLCMPSSGKIIFLFTCKKIVIPSAYYVTNSCHCTCFLVACKSMDCNLMA